MLPWTAKALKELGEENPNVFKETFNLECAVINDPVSDTPLILPIGRHHRK